MADPVFQGFKVGLVIHMTDHNSYAEYRDITVAGPGEHDGGWYWFGQYCVNGRRDGDPHSAYLMIRPHPDYMGEPLAQPEDYRHLWGMNSREGNNNARFGLWSPVGPAGYSGIGDIFNRNVKPSYSDFVCIANEFLIPAPVGEKLWTDEGTKASGEGSMWAIEDGAAGDPEWRRFVARDSYSAPAGGLRINPELIEMI
jgi:hypothetical protein